MIWRFKWWAKMRTSDYYLYKFYKSLHRQFIRWKNFCCLFFCHKLLAAPRRKYNSKYTSYLHYKNELYEEAGESYMHVVVSMKLWSFDILFIRIDLCFQISSEKILLWNISWHFYILYSHTFLYFIILIWRMSLWYKGI